MRTLRSPHTHQRHSLPCEGQSPGWQVWLSPPPLPSPCSGGSGWPPRAAPAFGRLRSPQVAGRWGCGGPVSPSPCPRDGGSSLLGEAGSVSHPRLGFSLKSMGWEGGETRGVTVENWVTQLWCWPQPHHLPHRWRQQLAHYSLRLSLAPCFFSCWERDASACVRERAREGGREGRRLERREAARRRAPVPVTASSLSHLAPGCSCLPPGGRVPLWSVLREAPLTLPRRFAWLPPFYFSNFLKFSLFHSPSAGGREGRRMRGERGEPTAARAAGRGCWSPVFSPEAGLPGDSAAGCPPFLAAGIRRERRWEAGPGCRQPAGSCTRSGEAAAAPHRAPAQILALPRLARQRRSATPGPAVVAAGAQLGSARLGSAQPGSAQPGSAQFSTAQLSPAPVL